MGVNINNTAFLEAVFADAAPGVHTVIAAFHGDPATKDRDESARFWCGRPWFPGRPVPQYFDYCNSYFTVAGFEPNPETGELRRRKEQFVAMVVVMVDDIGTKVDFSKICIPPSALIETSPGNYQGSYFLKADSDSRDRDVCERLVNRMVAAGLAINSSDPGMKGVTRYARLPVGANEKPKYIRQLGHPFTVRCNVFEPTRRYSVREIAAAYRLDMTPDRPRAVIPITAASANRATRRFSALVEVFQALGMYHGRRGHWHQVTCPWLDDHTDRADTGAALSEPSEANNWAGGFVCHHGHCRNVYGMKDIRAWLRDMQRKLEGRVS